MNWTASRNPKGYGRFWAGGPVYAHRFYYELFRGPVENGLHVLHRCDNPSCVNPDHLFLGTNKDNSDDKMAKGRFSRHGKGGLRGSRNLLAKLTDEQVEEIRSIKGRTQVEIAAIYGVDRSRISLIRNGKAYK